jgi:hypothetical protein
MKANRLALCIVAALAVLAAGCSNHSADTEAPVFLSVAITQGAADVDMSVPVDVVITSMTFDSHFKSPDQTSASSQEDVILSEWVVTPIRTDGGTVASPVWHNYYEVYVPAGGTATLQNYRIFPSDFFTQPPLNQLFPENGGIDVETGKRTIRQRLHIEVYGKTVAGERISLPFDVNLNFYYATQ